MSNIIKKVFFEVNLFNYVLENNIVKKKRIAFFLVETNDPDTRIMPIGANPTEDALNWVSVQVEIKKNDQRNMQDSGGSADK